MRYLIILAVLVLAACSGSVKKPDNLVSEQTMVDVFYDLAVIDAMRSQQPARVNFAPNLQQYVYEKYDIDSLQFAESNRYYAADVERYRNMVQQVAKKLRDEQKALEDKTGVAPEADSAEGQIR